MRTILSLLLAAPASAATPAYEGVALAVHGGTGVGKKEMTPELERGIRAGLEAALRRGKETLDKGGSSLDAVEQAIRVLEDDPLFNAGRGAVFTLEGRNELDASIMEGKAKRAGAVAGVTVLKNPISAARAVMEKSPHVMMVGRGAEVFATQAGLEVVDPAWFWTEPRWRAIQERWREKGTKRPAERRSEWSTVGAVAVDGRGSLAAGTSTGGMTGKRFGRVGDSPVIGAGTYADDAACAVSATGHGEYFIRYAVAHDIAALVKYKRQAVERAGHDVINRDLKAAGGEGGVIALDPRGRLAMPYNSEGMYRGFIARDGKLRVFLYED